MKKREIQKLTLNKETLRGLEERPLEKAKGAAVTGFPSCWDVGCPVTRDFRC
jgi:hypothetical protein